MEYTYVLFATKLKLKKSDFWYGLISLFVSTDWVDLESYFDWVVNIYEWCKIPFSAEVNVVLFWLQIKYDDIALLQNVE